MMDALELRLDDEVEAYAPGDRVEGTARWALTEAPRRLDLRLFWFTRGRGTTDTETVAERAFEMPAARGEECFAFELPRAPWSFSGRLITLVWGLELVAFPGKQVCRREIVVAPDAEEVLLHECGPESLSH